ncbi:MAG: methylated-DNA--[protein]-cysteine S-methyltransferase [Thermodesulfobacteria bacterium]|nr:methylated-DNA--[protein]-cysteine S-methyltransferase [Thermodesulfobacteriota bacterium]
MTNFSKKEEKFFEARLRVGRQPFFALWNSAGRLLLLGFGHHPSPRAWSRLERFLGPLSPEGAPRHLVSSLEEVLAAYLEGREQNPSYPLKPLGTPFQLKVWEALCEIPYGETRTYGWLAQRIGRPRAFRAVGRALGDNPLPIFIPCHRIVGVHGLGGFSGGLEVKRFLLRLEASKDFRQ